MSNHNDGHRSRMRERMMTEGLSSFQDHEVLEMLLYQSILRKDTNKIAHALLEAFGSFHNLFSATPEQLMTVEGVSQVAACNLAILKEVFFRYQRGDKQRIKLTGVKSLVDYAKARIANCYVEQLMVIYTDNATKCLHWEIYCSNSGEAVAVNVKKIVSTSVRLGASGVILCHTHPNGLVDPSDADVKFTRNLFYALAGLNTVILDHVIFNGDNQAFSFYEEGIMQRIQKDYLKSFL